MDDFFEEQEFEDRPKHITVGQAIGHSLIVLLLVVVLCCWCGYEFFQACMKPVGDGSVEKVIQVTEGYTTEQILDDLEAEGMITSSLMSRLYMKLFGAGTVFAGEYRLNDGMSVSEIIAYISKAENGMLESNTLTITEGMLATQIASRISEIYPEYTQKDILKQWNDINYIKELSKDYEFLNPSEMKSNEIKVKLEGYLYPKTYFLKKETTLDEITRTLLSQFNKEVYKPYKSEFKESKYSIQELVTLASVVQFETGAPKDMKIIAGVFYNRLEQGMKLESSATVCYAMDEINPVACETNPHIKSPYNTYRVEGLPIAPICSPDVNAMRSVLEPDDNDYLFFAADIKNVSTTNPGGVFYSKTFEEHNRVLQELDLFSY